MKRKKLKLSNFWIEFEMEGGVYWTGFVSEISAFRAMDKAEAEVAIYQDLAECRVVIVEKI